MSRKICVVVNGKSGRNSRDADAVADAMAVFGPGAFRVDWDPATDMADAIGPALERGPEIVVAAGGDGTVMAVAGAMLGRGVPMSVLPLGTFNFFARGLGLSETPQEAARQILEGRVHDIRIGVVNGQVFLNNASMGIYPAILRDRENVYKRWGRSRLAAHWSVIRTFLRFQRPMTMKITADGRSFGRRSALVFVARSAYQLKLFNIDGTDAIERDEFAVVVLRARKRLDLFRAAWHLAMHTPTRGDDYELIRARDIDIELRRKKALLAFDGEKAKLEGPFRFRMAETPLTIVAPPKPGPGADVRS